MSFKNILPEEIYRMLPKEIEETHLFGVIVFSYEELMKAHKLGLIRYYFDEEKDHMKVDQKSYYDRRKTLEKAYNDILPTLTNNPKQVIPRHPEEIAKNIYEELAYYNQHHNVNLITEDIIKGTMKAIVGTERLPRFTDMEKYRNIFLSSEVIIKK